MKLWNRLRQRKWLTVSIIIAIIVIIGCWWLYGRGTARTISSFAECAEAGYPVTESNPPLCRYGNRTFLGPERPETTPSAAISNIDFDILVDGDTHQDIPAHGQAFINTPAEWQAYWRSVHAGLATLPPLIPVDFADTSVVAVSLGAQATSGYGLKITTITADEAGATVNVTETAPTITCTVAQVTTNRYLIVRTAKLTPPVKFRITPDKRHCQ